MVPLIVIFFHARLRVTFSVNLLAAFIFVLWFILRVCGEIWN